MTENNKIIIGRFAKPYGVHGWIKVLSFTDPIENLLNYKPWQIQHGGQWQTVSIQNGKMHGQFLVVKLENVDNPETAKQYTHDLIAVERSVLAPLAENEYYWADLVGLQVRTIQGIALGIVESLMETGSNDVLVVKGKDRERLIPYLSKVIQSVDLKKNLIIVDWDADF